MTNRADSSPIPVKQIAKTFRLTGWISFWFQLFLAIISSVILLFVSVPTRSPATGASPSTGIGVVLTVCGIIVLGFNMYWAVLRYVPIGRQLEGSPGSRPKKADVIQVLRTGLIASLVGMLLALLGAEAIVGLLFAKAVSQGGAGFVNVDPAKFIQTLDVMVVQASVHVILAQFGAIAASLWLLNTMSGKRKDEG